MLIRTMERCIECGQLLYMRLYPLPNPNDLSEHLEVEVMNGQIENIASCVYGDRNGVLCITPIMGQGEKDPDYCCIHCGWWA